MKGQRNLKERSSHDGVNIIKRLKVLAYNLWWSWNPRAQAVFQELSPLVWETTNHNPVALLAQCSETELKARLGDDEFRKRVLLVLKSFDEYMKRKSRYPLKNKRGKANNLVAYFCAEFGIHECLPLYSGGLGILAGDHVKSASDLRIPFVGIGLFYRQGYFKQHIDASGYQQELYPAANPALIPVELVKNADGKPVLCNVTIGDAIVHAQGWKIRVGQSTLYLLDTDIPENDEQARGITALAYGGDINTRIRQEIVLGIGGVRFLRAIGITPSVYHMNEGHAAFLTLELLREHLMEKTPKEASENMVREKCIFTTHTPVAAGHDRFPRDLVGATLHGYMEKAGLSMEDLMRYGQPSSSISNNEFTMTILGLKMSRAANGVSKKHGEISRVMWNELYPTLSADDVPIGYITNGVHLPSWAASTSWEFWERHNSHRWKEHLHDPAFWKHISDPKVVSDEELWALRYQLRRELIEFIRVQSQHQHVFSAGGDEALGNLLSFDALTIGFARRFAPYKRAPLLFSDLAQVAELFDDPQRPVQIIYAGKAHPRDGDGKEFLRQIIDITRQRSLNAKVIFLENYDMNIARRLVSGCDVWLNTPRRPLEASGTSGEKIAINGGLQLSILDGWWLEAYNGSNGWAIGKGVEDNESSQTIDARDAESLYHLLSNEVIPLFYDRGNGAIPRKWIARMRNAMRTIIPVYNTHRMVMEYATKYYFPA